ncbi:FtsX-like permease family protein [Rathayibacter rathayi]|uniref:ABC3 transporter permease C-terminal domain-containing protein n=1 Tax=Rathayibacter rathayi TaxID=33887 RepID=A0ABX5A8G4_RATRA|nr:FtsX-like permease family protein [Rathayibacter rathayi]PPF23082.1 hypothetical protein C5C34_10090 [Rathayibacter rathayi]PPG91340.1 hypothetical protein C5C22_14150 [Rathayibacter rathayi]PPH30421.1 hypothetical protein C5C28_14095 [Rathayibacter rathayi]PPH73273.1 hypothetical protein C5C40_13945 [Rathayibacter rathayi]
MIRLILADLRTDAASRLGPFVTVVGAALVLAFGLCLVETGAAMDTEAGQGLINMAVAVLVVSVSTALLVVGAVSKLAVDLRRQEFARWRLAGVQPSSVRRVILGQSVVVALAGSALGAGIAALIVPTLLEQLLASATGTPLSLRFGVPSAIADVVLVCVLVLAASIPAARRAARTEPLAVLRASTAPAARMSVRRWIVTAVLLVPLALAGQGMVTDDRAKILWLGTLLAPILVLVVAALGPLTFPAAVRVWTSLLPARVSAAWYLARHNARHDIGLSAAAVTPMMIAVALIGGFFAALETTISAVTITQEVPPDYFTISSGGAMSLLALLVGPPVVLALLGSAVVVLVAGRDRDRRTALLRAAGATDATIIASSVGEAVVHALTAFLLGTGVIAVAATMVAVALSTSRHIVVVPSIPLGAPTVVLLVGLALVLASTLLPTLHALRTPIPRALAAE